MVLGRGTHSALPTDVEMDDISRILIAKAKGLTPRWMNRLTKNIGDTGTTVDVKSVGGDSPHILVTIRNTTGETAISSFGAPGQDKYYQAQTHDGKLLRAYVAKVGAVFHRSVMRTFSYPHMTRICFLSASLNP